MSKIHLQLKSSLQNPICHLKASPIHGLGLFAKIDIPKGTKISKWDFGIEMTYDEYKDKYGKDHYRHCYLRMPWQKLICDKERNNLITFVNSSDQPNCFLKKRWLIANQDIKQGEELLLKYAF